MSTIISPFSPAEVRAIFAALRGLSYQDLDGARILNGVGFNQADTVAGNRLAAQETLSIPQLQKAKSLLRKYHRQIPKDIYDTIFAEDKAAETLAAAIQQELSL